jgi:hypothetical protein
MLIFEPSEDNDRELISALYLRLMATNFSG